ncbi:DNA mismatch repair endonuclease MutL [Fusibacter tunisiensis]|uniref:DNA mismatch repair protein MutL n=1 Tax=Fusibacter tunisiensis TaxID=1008308 RepID=A0ABS2MT65_9FIRM|nr:DNA mismatch repair endonuclease MutL [Fusibacter tunisiensis]MBM7562578.1 DNA mismatch repair protein MutL [Fusibacter tunisiensis]
MKTNRIVRLDAGTASKIAAGEVVEKPAMVVKELVENAIDAGASEILVSISKGGKRLIRVTDNGSGINKEDLPLVFERHATSKIRTIEDLYSVVSLGFRGEALASISAVSNIELITMQEADESGIKVEASGGKILKTTPVGAVRGTSISVKDLFFNTPARLKFLKSDQAETRAITELISVLAISHPEVSFKYVVDDHRQFDTPGKDKLDQAIYSIYEPELMKHLVGVDAQDGGMTLRGYISKYGYTKGTRAHQFVFVNGRYVKSDLIRDVIQMAYKPYLMHNRYPVCFLFMDIKADYIDVNIHPAKTEIKFHDEGAVKQLIYIGLKKAFNLYNQTPEVTFSEKEVFKKPEVQSYSEVVEKPIEKPVQKFVDRPVKKSNSEFDASIMEAMAAFGREVTVPEQEVVLSSAYDDLVYIGVYNSTYLMFEKEKHLVMIDQHAAHEKVLYEQFMTAFNKQKVEGQLLLIPEPIELNSLDFSKLETANLFLEQLGFSYDVFGDQTVVLRAIPSLFGVSAAQTLFLEVLEGIEDGLTRHIQEKIASKACKAAIKANDIISEMEVDALINRLKMLKDPYTCPHGRPIMIQIQHTEIERKFKRII